MKKTGQLRKQEDGRPNKSNPEVTLSGGKTLQQLHISKVASSRYQKFYRMPEEKKLEMINYAVRRVERKEEAREKEGERARH